MDPVCGCCSNSTAVHGRWADTGVTDTKTEPPFSQLCSALVEDVHELFVDLHKPGRQTLSLRTSQDMTQSCPLPPRMPHWVTPRSLQGDIVVLKTQLYACS